MVIGCNWGPHVCYDMVNRNLYIAKATATAASLPAVTFTRSLPGGRVRYAEMPPEDRKLYGIGALLYLTDLEEVGSVASGVLLELVGGILGGVSRVVATFFVPFRWRF